MVRALALCACQATDDKPAVMQAAAVIYGVSLLTLYISSTLYVASGSRQAVVAMLFLLRVGDLAEDRKTAVRGAPPKSILFARATNTFAAVTVLPATTL